MEYRMEYQELRTAADQALVELQDHELEPLAEEFSAMLEYMKMMDEADTESLDPTSHVFDSGEHLRDDIPVQDSKQRRALLDQAPETEGTLIAVPRVIP